MRCDYIIVQAGGKGTRMQHLTENKPKALVPVDNLPMLFHLFRKFPNKRFIIISDYKIEVMRRYLAAFADVDYLIVDTEGENGTCSGIARSLRKIPDSTPFMIIWSDLILPKDFELPEKDDNYIGLSKNFQCRWRYKDGKFEEISSQKYGVAGLFLFKDKKQIENVPQSGEFVKWLQEQNKIFNPHDLHKTQECGLFSIWENMTHNHLDSRCRPFNSMEVKGDCIVKQGIDEQGRKLAIREKAWYRHMEKLNYKNIPKIYSYEPLTMQKLEGHNIFEYHFNYEEKIGVLKRIVQCLKDLHNLESCPVDYFSINNAYLTKTFDRLEKIRDLVPFANERYIKINGVKCRNVFFYREVLEKYIENYKCKEFKLIHGDNTFSNMMLDENLSPVLIDPRGYFGFTELYGDPVYDWAKLYYSIVGDYDQFNLKKFILHIKETEVELNIETNGWKDVENEFIDLVKDEVSEIELKLIHAVIWLSLTTYAWEDYDSICGAFYNGVYYLEKVLGEIEND